MRIIIIGQSGLSKGNFMEKVKEYAATQGKLFHFC
jgi:nucleoside-triphosphatase THEP1